MRLLLVLTLRGITTDVEIRSRREPIAEKSALEASGSATTEHADHLNAVGGFTDPFGFTPHAR